MSGVNKEIQQRNEKWLIDISEDTKVSNKLQIGEWGSGAFEIPSDFIGTLVTFKGSLDGTNYDTIRDSDDAYHTAMTVAAGKIYHIPQDAFAYRWVRIEATSVQTATDKPVVVFFKG